MLPNGPLVRSALARGHGGYADVRLGGDDLRLYVAPLAEIGGPAAGGACRRSVDAGSQETLERPPRRLLPPGCGRLLAALAVALLMRRALRPLVALADAAAEIERTGDPRRRLPQPAAGDEVGRLAVTLNAILADSSVHARPSSGSSPRRRTSCELR